MNTLEWCLLIAIIVMDILFLLAIILIKPNKRRDTSYFKKKSYAHRGLHGGKIPENSLWAFREAVSAGFGVELDVQMTRDGVLVVFHDDTLDRMCNVKGGIKDYSYEELQSFRLKDTEERIPLFSDVLKTLDGADLICELKSANGVRNYYFCEKVFEMLQTYKGEYCVESFSPFIMGWFAKNHPEIIRGQLSCDLMHDRSLSLITRFLLTHLLLNRVSKPDFIAYSYKDINKLGFRLCKVFYSPFLVAWTARGEEAEKKAWGSFDSVIFEKLG